MIKVAGKRVVLYGYNILVGLPKLGAAYAFFLSDGEAQAWSNDRLCHVATSSNVAWTLTNDPKS